ncbi:hypothetical protein AKJ09_02650 [Labilithrix luteola]|uniref:Uncharacterized protein n=2 Tax=Labilithrix luteola TaxID=1391654 RepID=A0A0K1PRI1_9BACT|nr:hypothetical protein AKJ09_02650 [Labilithrix luteola]
MSGMLLVTGAGCASVLGFDEFLPGQAPADSDASADTGATNDGPPVGLGESADADLYVNPQGDDANDGKREHPVRSVNKALLLAAASGPNQKFPLRIAACAGTYSETGFTLTGGIELRGGYDCTSWYRPVSKDDVVGTTYKSPSELSNAKPESDQFISLQPDDSGAPRLDGWTITVDEASAAVRTAGDAVLTELTIANRTKPSDSSSVRSQTFGIAVGPESGTATIEHCSVTVNQSNGRRTGTAPDDVSVGVGIGIAGSSRVRRNSLTTSSVIGSCEGIVLGGAKDVQLVENAIAVVSCTGTAPGIAAIGISATSSDVTSVRNSIVITAPAQTDIANSAAAVGVYLVSGGTFDSDGDRVIAPAVVVPNQRLLFNGFLDSAGVLTRVVNASIVFNASKTITLDDSAGIRLLAPSNALLAHNSMYFSGADADGGSIYGISLSNSVTGAIKIDSNLVVTEDHRPAFIRASCQVSAVAELLHNRHAGFDPSLVGTGCPSKATLEDLQSGDAGDNVLFTCPGECSKLFANSGLDTTETGLRLTDAGCSGFQVPSNDAVPVDGRGIARSKGTTTAGAFEAPCK